MFYRINSTITGQRKPKENKRKKKKRNQERRYSEGEASDYENNNNNMHSEIGGKNKQSNNICNGNCRIENENTVNSKASQRKQQQNSKRHNKKSDHSEMKSGLMFDIEI